MIDYDAVSIRRRTLAALAGNRAPGFHFAGYFLGFEWPRIGERAVLQTIVEDDKRGRVMSLYTAAFLGMSPFGAIAAGALADVVGVAATLTAGGICCALAGLYIAGKRELLREHMGPIYARLGIAPR